MKLLSSKPLSFALYSILAVLSIGLVLSLNISRQKVFALPSSTPELPTYVPEVFIPKTIMNTLSWKKYENKEFGISFKYPSDWQIFENNSYGYIDIGLNPKGKKYYSEGVEVHLVHISIQPVPETFNYGKEFGVRVLIGDIPFIHYRSSAPHIADNYHTVLRNHRISINEAGNLYQQPHNIYENILASFIIK